MPRPVTTTRFMVLFGRTRTFFFFLGPYLFFEPKTKDLTSFLHASTRLIPLASPHTGNSLVAPINPTHHVHGSQLTMTVLWPSSNKLSAFFCSRNNRTRSQHFTVYLRCNREITTKKNRPQRKKRPTTKQQPRYYSNSKSNSISHIDSRRASILTPLQTNI